MFAKALSRTDVHLWKFHYLLAVLSAYARHRALILIGAAAHAETAGSADRPIGSGQRQNEHKCEY